VVAAAHITPVHMQSVIEMPKKLLKATYTCSCRFNLGGNYGMDFPSLYYQKMDCTQAKSEIESSVAVNTTASTTTGTAGKWIFNAANLQYHYNLQVQYTCTASFLGSTVQKPAGLQSCVAASPAAQNQSAVPPNLHTWTGPYSQCVHTVTLCNVSSQISALKPMANTCYLVWLENKLCPTTYQVVHIQVTKVKRFLI
jgi:hypothetical protein